MAILVADNKTTIGGVPVNEYFLTKHNPKQIAMPTAKLSKVIGVTIHNTDWINTSSATTPAEQYTRATVNGNMGTVRVHFYVDNKCTWQNLPLTLSGWHAADGNGDGNRKTISIECIMGSSYNASDKASEDNAAKLCAALLLKYGLGIQNLYTHTHWLNVRDGKKGTVDQLNVMKNRYKMCPAYILPHWETFKKKVQSYMQSESITVPSQPETPTAGDAIQIGDTVYVKKYAIDSSGKKASSIYAGAKNPLIVKSIKGNICTLYKDSVAVYRMDKIYLEKEYSGTSFKIGGLVKLKPGAVWWGSGATPPSWVFKRTYYLQQWDVISGRAVIGTTPRSKSGTITGSIAISNLEPI